MNDKQLALVTYEQAKRLKAAGFDWPILEYYRDHPDQHDVVWKSVDRMCNFFDQNSEEGHYSAPTVALALKWMRDVEDINGNVICGYKNGQEFYWYEIFLGDEWKESCDFDTYESAESALLDELLNLIEK